jgi:hypothetical protein
VPGFRGGSQPWFAHGLPADLSGLEWLALWQQSFANGPEVQWAPECWGGLRRSFADVLPVASLPKAPVGLLALRVQKAERLGASR